MSWWFLFENVFFTSCLKYLGTEGCNGGVMDEAFNYIKKNNGIDTEESYPYTAKVSYFAYFKLYYIIYYDAIYLREVCW